MDYYLVDYENVNKDGLNGVAKLNPDDVVIIFYSENSSTMTFGLHKRLNESPAEILYKKVGTGSKNALDFQLASFLGYLICETKGVDCNFYIVSNDKGFEPLVSFWKPKANVQSVINMSKENGLMAQKELTEEVRKLIKDKDDAETVAKMIMKYKTKSGLNNALMKKFPSKNNKKSSQIYTAIKPLIKDKKGV